MGNYLFVYGTLKKGFVNHNFLKGQKYHGDYEVDGVKMFDMGGAPALVIVDLPYGTEAHSQKASGEIWEVDNDALKAIDRLEGHPNLYERMEIGWWKLSTSSHPDAAKEVGLEVPLQAYIFKQKLVACPLIKEWTRQPAFIMDQTRGRLL